MVHMAPICRNKLVVSDTEITLFYGSSCSVDKLLTMILFAQQHIPSVFSINTIHMDFDKFYKHSPALVLSRYSIIRNVLYIYHFSRQPGIWLNFTYDEMFNLFSTQNTFNMLVLFKTNPGDAYLGKRQILGPQKYRYIPSVQIRLRK